MKDLFRWFRSGATNAPTPASSAGAATSNVDLVACIRDAWGWNGIRPVAVMAENAFGNLMIRDEAG